MPANTKAADDIFRAVSALQKSGRWKDSRAMAEDALARGKNPALSYLAGLACNELGDLPAASRHLQDAVAQERSFYALLALGVVFIRLDQPQNAVTALTGALALRPGAPDALASLGTAQMNLENYPAAETALLQSVQSAPTAEAFFNLGILCLRTSRPENAVTFFSKAVELNEKNLQNWEYLAQTYYLLGQFVHAILIFLKLAKDHPQNLRFRHLLSVVLREFNPVKYEPVFADALRFCLEEERLSLDNLSGAFVTLARRDPDRPALQKSLAIMDFDTFQRDVGTQFVAECCDPLFLRALESFIIRDYSFERVLSFMRRMLLERSMKEAAPDPETLNLVCALSAQCFLTEYVYDETPQETQHLETLTARLRGCNAWTPRVMEDVGLLSAYRPLAAVAADIPFLAPEPPPAPDSPSLARLLDSQLTDIRRERELETTIPCLKISGDEVSHKVRAMYEQNPYPRWKHAFSDPDSLNPCVDLAALRAQAPGGRLQILNAGCGTGRHIAISHANFPHSDILGVDLSRASLSFALKRCREYGLENVTLMQADILELRELGRSFDIIESAGVLHHMADPMQGWRVLADILKPGGYMRIGLYSELARRDVVACREFIAQNGFAPDLAGIRECRRALMALPPLHPARQIAGSPDFYSTSLCRDLIFHVQEHRFTIPQIKECLDTLGLEFLSFNITNSRTLNNYRKEYPADRRLGSLENWHAFEEKNPHTFRNMYQFWCRKPVSN